MNLFTKAKLLFLLLTLSTCNLYAQKQGQALIDSLLKELPRQKEDTNKVNLLLSVSMAYYSRSDQDNCIKYANQSLELATKLGWKKGIGVANNDLGFGFQDKAQYGLATEYFTKALHIYEEAGNKLFIAGVTISLGGNLLSLHDYPRALEYFYKSLKMSEEIGDKWRAIYSINDIAIVYDDMKDYPKALENYFKAFKIVEGAGLSESDLKGTTALLNDNIGRVYCDGLGDYPKALEYFLKSLKTAKEIGDTSLIAGLTGNIGNVYLHQKDYRSALNYFDSSLMFSEKIGARITTGYALHNIGGLFLAIVKDTATKMTNPAKYSKIGTSKYLQDIPMDRNALLKRAISYQEKSIAIGKETSNTNLIQQSYETLASAYQLSGDYKSAFEAAENFRAIKDSVFSAENNKNIIQQGMNYEFEKREAVTKVESEKKIQKQKLIRNGFVGGFAVLLLFAGVTLNQRNKIRAGKKQSDELLLNILPAEVAEELKAKGSAEAKLIDEVTVLFTDFKGFTQLSEKLSPKALVAEINDCFSAFDHIMQKYGVEKIKTIGDSYMAAGGLPTPNRTHPDDVVKAAIEIQQYMQEHKERKGVAGEPFFEIRIGVHTGPVVAGIVGIKKFQYDIWGDTVNIASRMESSGAAGKVNISHATYELVKEKFTCEYRGEIEAKGKGQLKMYYVSW